MKTLLIITLIIVSVLLLCNLIYVSCCEISDDYFNDIMDFSNDKEIKSLQ